MVQFLPVGRTEAGPALDQYVFGVEKSSGLAFQLTESIPVDCDGKRRRTLCLNTLLSASLESCNLETAVSYFSNILPKKWLVFLGQ